MNTKYLMTFAANTAGYRLHAHGCSQAVSSKNVHLLPETFETIEQARAYADEDEQTKGGEKANFRVCKCAKE